jgi:chorismate dehydratase
MYDLGAIWKQYTGLPFVFAVWAAKQPLPSSFLKEFNEANRSGVASLPDVIAQNHCDFYDLEIYFRQNIKYHLDEQMLAGMQRFLQEISGPDTMHHK